MPILIAVNPYKHLNIYTDDHIKHYRKYFFQLKKNPNEIEAPIPHLYHIAEAAYQDMINEKKNQSIIISGESGSGKTQSTKIILKYLAVSSLHTDSQSISNSQKTQKNQNTVEKQVLDSNPLLEAFGNAKTVRNNNSSRFGKFIQVQFTEHGKIIAARIYNYLLEKSRVVSIQPDERNYHIFYQIIQGADESERKKHYIKDLEYYKYINRGCFEVEDTDDKANFIETKECMEKLNIKPEEMTYIFNVVMGILYLGNVEFKEVTINGSGGSEIDTDTMEDFKIASELLGVSEDKLKTILTIKKLKDRMDNKMIERNLSVDQAYNCRDALSKAVYSRMFDYIVYKVNSAIANKEELHKHDKDKIRKIGLLDIFGFENFEVNSFEQLCINYANERLQQFFNNHIFKLEQEEYRKEGIDWSKVEFSDNKDILDLIDDPKKSIFSLLDDEGLTQTRNDESFKNKIYQNLNKNNSLGEEEEDFFSINHYAGLVYYYVYGFIEKNKDELTPDIIAALEKSKNRLIRKVFGKKEEEEKAKSSKKSNAPNKLQSDSLSKQFKKQLDELMKMLALSNPRYVKCIKPNSLKKPLVLESADVMEQLLSAGVLEAVKIRKQGYSIRRTQEEFLKRYHPLAPQIDLKQCDRTKEYREAILEMLKLLEENPDIKPYFDKDKKLIQFGQTKIFMKEEVKNILESKLSRIKYIVRIQLKFLGWRVYKKVWKYLNSVKKIQARFRGNEVRIFVTMVKLTVKIQKYMRFYFKKKRIFKHLHELARENMKRKEMERLEMLRKKEEEKLRELEANGPISARGGTPNNATNYNTNANSNTSMMEEEVEKVGAKKKPSGKRVNKNKLNSKTGLIRLERDSFVSKKESIGDISTSDLQLCNELGAFTKSRQNYYKKQTKSNFADLLQTDLESVHEEMKHRLEVLTEELTNTKKEKESLLTELNTQKEETKRKDKEIEILKSTVETNTFKANLDSFHENVEKIGSDLKKGFSEASQLPHTCDHLDEIRKLKKEIAEKEGLMDVLNFKIDGLEKSNNDMQSLNETLKEQLNKRTEKMNKEMSDLYQQIRDLELKKNEFERANRSLLEHSASIQYKTEDRDDSFQLNLKSSNNLNDSKLNELKSDNKHLKKKIEEIKSKYEKEIQNYKNEIFIKENRIKDIESNYTKIEKELKEKSENYSNMKVEYDMCKEKIQEMKVKLENLSKNNKFQEYEQEMHKLKVEFDSGIKKKDQEIEELKETVEMTSAQVERLKKMEKALKNELNVKNDELNRRQEMLREARLENDKLMDDTMLIKKENFNLSSKLEVLEIEFKNKHEHENKIRQQELKNLKEKEKKYEKLLIEMKETLRRKQRVIDNKKKMNLMLVDLAKIKRGEVQCIETMQYSNSSNIKDTLAKIRENEKEILSRFVFFNFINFFRLGEISANPDNTDSEEEDEDDSEGKDNKT